MSQSISESKPSSYSLLTDNASPLERALEHTLSKHLDQVAPPLPQLRNAHQTPESALPHLAADRMVTYWKKEDSVKIKRSQVASAQVERKKAGTKEGVRIALDAIGYGCQVNSRYESPELPPFTLDVIAWQHSKGTVNSELIDQLIDKLNENKSTRDTIELSLSYGVFSSWGMTASIPPAVNITPVDGKASLWPQENHTSDLGMAMALGVAVTVKHIYATAI